MHNLGLIGDIGGTNARFAFAHQNENGTIDMSNQEQVKCEDYSNIFDAIDCYLTRNLNGHKLVSGCFAIAAPIGDGSRVDMTNNHWGFETEKLRKALGVDAFSIINDFAAIAYALPNLQPADCLQLTQKPIRFKLLNESQTYSVIGPGTGLGVGGLISCEQKFHVLTSEGGHATFAPGSELEVELFYVLRKRYSRLSYERILSGSGLVNLYQAFAEVEGVEPQNLEVSAIGQNAIDNNDELCVKTLSQFCAILGSFAGDIALVYNAIDGVFIAGGIMPKYQQFLLNSSFMQRFVNKGRYQSTMENIPVQLITHPNPGLLGSASNILAQ